MQFPLPTRKRKAKQQVVNHQILNNQNQSSNSSQYKKEIISIQCMAVSWTFIFLFGIVYLTFQVKQHQLLQHKQSSVESTHLTRNLKPLIQKDLINTHQGHAGLARHHHLQQQQQQQQQEKVSKPKSEMKTETPVLKNKIQKQSKPNTKSIDDNKCYASISELSELERNPKKTKNRHMVQPPKDHNITLACCETTAGPISFLIHFSWAPIGAQRVHDMIISQYFSSQIALFRCLKNFLCQFGLAGDKSLNKKFDKNLVDDPNWLPEGPKYRKNEDGVKRFSRGYLAFAGAGKNSRGNQLIMALADNAYLGGGSPWEVPWGEVVGNRSYATLEKIYTGYGEKGPSQGLLRKLGGASKEIKTQFPKMDYILSCQIQDSIRLT